MEDKFKKMEKTLYDYRKLDTAINNIDIDIEHMKNDITLKAISYEEKSSPTNAFSSTVENEVIKRSEHMEKEIARLRSLKADKMALRTKIYNALKDLKENEYKLVEMRYLSKYKKSWIEIGMELSFNKDYCQQLRNKIINSLIESIFP
ncbi:xanthine dehydrogenase [Clostridium beijerinckii]|uniref:Xanthine dehydrogenase n=1 Tax=Clostridium beijerinckii TaxID=1520 RepID=A0A7X9XQS6_CLOBE|nr:xanthine dehydrogenase [Clostridium beijerinckii]NMF06271.1 xanthine dehydrogenase [Clostridium beijerinckii]